MAMVSNMTSRLLLSFIFLSGNNLPAQDTQCNLFGLLHHDNNKKISFLGSEKVEVSLERSKLFDWQMLDSTFNFISNEMKLVVKPVDALPYCILFSGQNILIIEKGDTTILNEEVDSLELIDKKMPFNSSWKIGKKSFLDISHDSGKVLKIEILELQRRISLWVTHINNRPEIKKIKIDWYDTGNYLLMVYLSGKSPYLLDYYDAKQKGGISLFFKYRENYISDVLLYEMTQKAGDKSKESNSLAYDLPPKGASKILSIKYNIDGTIKNKSKSVIAGCFKFR